MKAYITVSLDATGLFQFLALWVAKKGGTSGRKLYTLLYLFFFGAGIIVGNVRVAPLLMSSRPHLLIHMSQDPVILSGTPFLAYLTDAMQISPTPWIFSQFVSCNVGEYLRSFSLGDSAVAHIVW